MKVLSNRWPNLALAFLTVAIGIIGYRYITDDYRADDAELHLRLGAAAEMKARHAASWRRERLGDAHVLVAALELMPAVHRVLRDHASGSDRQQAAAWLETIRSQYGYRSIILAGTHGQALMSVGQLMDPTFYDSLPAVDAGNIQFTKSQPQAVNEQPRLLLTQPLLAGTAERLGSVVLEMAPERELYPDLLDWPGAGNTGELILVRRDGDSVVFLNRARLSQPNQPLMMRRPMNLAALPAVQAVLGGTNHIDGIDYRGQRVAAAARKVPDSDWFVLAKMDTSEAVAAHDRETVRLIALLTAVLLPMFALVRLAVGRHNARISGEKHEANIRHETLLGRYNNLSRYANDAILFWQNGGQIIEVNERALDMYGYTRDEFLRLSIPDLRPPDLRGQFPELLSRLEKEKSVLMETGNMTKDGRRFPVEVNICRIDSDGQRLFQVIVRDISERKSAEDQVRRLNRLYAMLSECDAAIYSAIHEDELFQKICEISVRLGGFLIAWIGKADPESLHVTPLTSTGIEAEYLKEIVITTGCGPLGCGPSGLCIREGRPVSASDIRTDPMMAPWREAAERHGLRSSVCLPIKRNSRTTFVLGMYSGEADFFNEEETALAQKVGQNLSVALERMDLERERANAEERRRLSEERLRLALEAAEEAYWDWKLDTNDWYFSPRCFTMLGFQPGSVDFQLEGYGARIHPEDLPNVERVQNAVIRGDIGTSTGEFRVRHKDGRYIWVRSIARVVQHDQLGKPSRIVGTRTDITKRKTLEQEFLQAQKMESIGRLAGSVAHDFNNLLTVINGNATLLLEEVPADGPFFQQLEDVFEAGKRAAALTRQLLVFSRKQVEHREALNANDTITGLEKILRNLMGQNGNLHLELTTDISLVLADASHLEQIVMNLAINARDAIAPGGNVTIRTQELLVHGGDLMPERSGPYVRLTVQDDGSGMTPEVRQRIFEPFFTTKDRSHGTGLGLATVYGIVEGSGGFIEVESEVGKGSSFHVYLPVTSEPAATKEIVSRSRTGQERTETILLVEDDDAARRLATETLKRCGYRVLAAACAADAIDISGKYRKRIDAVVSDIMMPGMNGIDMTQRLSASRPGLRILYVSGYAGDAVDTTLLTGPGKTFIAKPYALDALAVKLRELLSDNSMPPSSDPDRMAA